MSDVVRVLRIVEYVGPREWVETTVARAIHGRRDVDAGKSITAVTLTQYPEVLQLASLSPAVEFNGPQPASQPLRQGDPIG